MIYCAFSSFLSSSIPYSTSALQAQHISKVPSCLFSPVYRSESSLTVSGCCFSYDTSACLSPVLWASFVSRTYLFLAFFFPVGPQLSYGLSKFCPEEEHWFHFFLSLLPHPLYDMGCLLELLRHFFFVTPPLFLFCLLSPCYFCSRGLRLKSVSRTRLRCSFSLSRLSSPCALP